MKGFLQRLFGGDGQNDKKVVPPRPASPLKIEPFSHGLVRIPALDFFGPHTTSPNGKFHLIWLDRNPEGTIGGHRYEGHGKWTLLNDDGATLATGRLERPQDGHVADNGTFILNDWMFGDGLNGRLCAFRADGQKLLEREFSANLGTNAISIDGRFATCQTAHAPGSPDSNRHFLFDLEQGLEIATWQQETGWTNSYEIDPVNRHVILVGQDDQRVGYGFDGEMLDRDGWQRTRIATGDIDVIRLVAESLEQNPSTDLRTAILAGLDVALATGEGWKQARALRIRGEIHERSGELEAAIEAYDRALTIDPQVGVARKLAKLQQMKSPKGARPAVTKSSRFEQQAQRFGIEHEVVQLDGGGKDWRFYPADNYKPVELAVLDRYQAEGWNGCAAEGGLILTLIKAASFHALPDRHADTFIEALYAKNVAFPEDRFEHSDFFAAIDQASREQIERNWAVIAASAGDTPRFYPRVQRDHVLGLFECLGVDRLRSIAEVFATASYDLRAGWPDLTLWRNGEIYFVEVKAPGDSMHASQVRLISSVLVPLGFRVGLAEVRPA
ncbi:MULTISPECIES: VRR-NUC domain-containing protein [unclassified Novosphingobium]|uniref:VRR-NUC domain-containing protein n=1 Tax=unclassified Novosphingobium TaxID=2644732 RepID=UPI0025F1E307|nr:MULTISPECIES: VRR-NUC domain-containing protein [unclassified Novosphingobium]HQV01900.1 VRR-NUC domain-containing protein [Novosphingobium sp.]